VSPDAYDVLIKTKEFEGFKAKHKNEHFTTIEIRKYIELTELGIQFKEACVTNKET
jgi:bisphosphoglycerate-independent phosphoglycerate mutase (AlkP superfamily)